MTAEDIKKQDNPWKEDSDKDDKTETSHTDWWDDKSESDEEVKVSKAELEKLRELEANKSKWLDEERKKRKELEQKLAEREEADREAEAKKLKEEWKFEALYNKTAQENKELRKEVTALKETDWLYNDMLAQQADELISKIPKENLEMVKKSTSWKSPQEQIELLKTFADTFWKKDFGWVPESGSESSPDKTKEDLAYEEAKKWWFNTLVNHIFKSKMGEN